MAIRVATRFMRGMEFSTEEALKKYLHEHPDADRSKHTVKKQDNKSEKSDSDDEPSAGSGKKNKVQQHAGRAGLHSSKALKGFSRELEALNKNYNSERDVEKIKAKADKAIGHVQLMLQEGDKILKLVKDPDVRADLNEHLPKGVGEDISRLSSAIEKARKKNREVGDDLYSSKSDAKLQPFDYYYAVKGLKEPVEDLHDAIHNLSSLALAWAK